MTGLPRRTFLLGAATTLVTSPVLAQHDDRLDYKEYRFIDYFSQRARGSFTAPPEDIVAANEILESMPTRDHFAIMQALAAIMRVGTTGELFNMRWKTFGNPLIVRFFHDVGYAGSFSRGDCTSWCGATVAWCLKRAGKRIPPNAASSQSFKNNVGSYGRKVTDPQPGDICVFTKIGDSAHGHVALFLSKSNDTVEVLGGNQLAHSQTNCGIGYRKSKIGALQMAINPTKSRTVSIYYLAGYFRPN